VIRQILSEASGEIDLSDANIVVSVGRGAKDQAGIDLVKELAIGQKRLVGRAKERSSGIMHAFIFWGFCVLLIRSITLYGEGFQT